jgi:hypothetical protein
MIRGSFLAQGIEAEILFAERSEGKKIVADSPTRLP